MSETITDNLPQDALVEAIRIIKEQGATPTSPGELRNGRMILCAGAALAAAGLSVTGRHNRRKEFELELVAASKSKSVLPIRQVFMELGWSMDTCDQSIINNDRFADSVRQDGVIQLFQRLIY
jgi:hypothetical protein